MSAALAILMGAIFDPLVSRRSLMPTRSAPRQNPNVR